jgi:hypothetical protein
MWIVERLFEALALSAGAVAAGGVGLAVVLRKRGLRWTWALLGLPAVLVLWRIDPLFGFASFMVAGLGSLLGASWHHTDLAHGADYAEAAHARLGVFQALRGASANRRVRRSGSWVDGGWLRLGRDQRGMPFCIPVGYESGCHTLVLGATGAGKTVSEAWIACRLIEAGHGAIVINPKGDRMLRGELQAVAERTGARLMSGSRRDQSPTTPTNADPIARSPTRRSPGSFHRAPLPAPGPALPRPRRPRHASRRGSRDPRVADGAWTPPSLR